MTSSLFVLSNANSHSGSRVPSLLPRKLSDSSSQYLKSTRNTNEIRFYLFFNLRFDKDIQHYILINYLPKAISLFSSWITILSKTLADLKSLFSPRCDLAFSSFNKPLNFDGPVVSLSLRVASALWIISLCVEDGVSFLFFFNERFHFGLVFDFLLVSVVMSVVK